MKKIEGYEKINEAGEYKKLPVGPYVVKITNVVDNVEKEYIEIYFDIVEPKEYKDYFKNLGQETNKDYSKTIRSYKTAAMPFFKSFTTSVEKSNNGYQWNWDEKSLIGKFVVVNMAEEEYDDGVSDEIKTSVKVRQFRSGEAYRKGEVKILDKKCLSDDEKAKFDARVNPAISETTVEINDDDLPF